MIRKIFAVCGIVVGIIIICMGTSLFMESSSAILESAAFGADFYTYIYEVARITAESTVEAILVLTRGFAFVLIAIGLTDICFFGWRLFEEPWRRKETKEEARPDLSDSVPTMPHEAVPVQETVPHNIPAPFRARSQSQDAEGESAENRGADETHTPDPDARPEPKIVSSPDDSEMASRRAVPVDYAHPHTTDTNASEELPEEIVEVYETTGIEEPAAESGPTFKEYASCSLEEHILNEDSGFQAHRSSFAAENKKADQDRSADEKQD